ncbi:MAG: Gfo/Idh/MocA family oxidoreductase [Planctomycetota bacterium]|nr:Gfo/Idh/MocA family oxidoreductase [Planctomycetota bacterium]
MQKYRVAQVGIGNRGKIHADAFLELSDRFELVGLCDLDREKLGAYARSKDLPAAILYDDAAKMMAKTKPDVFCFVTHPNLRLPLVELAAKHGVAGLAFEKPMATSLADAHKITELCHKYLIKTIVSHQQKYLPSFQKLKELLDAGAIGKVTRLDATCQAWLAQLGTHFVDYILWANGGARATWVAGHVHGSELLKDSHPSPNYVMGVLAFQNGVRSYVEFGHIAPSSMPKEKFWLDNRLTAYGTHGYVWCDTDNRWGALTKRTDGEVTGGEGEGWSVQERTRLQPLYLKDFIAWLDDDKRVHPCNIDITYHGYEIMEALCISAMERIRVDLPLDPSKCTDMLARMRKELPECP